MSTRRATVAELLSAVGDLQHNLARTDLVPEGSMLELQHGSPSAGRAWRLFYNPPKSGAQCTIPIDPLDHGWPNMGYLGWTKREALDTLHVANANVLAYIIAESIA